MTSEIDFNHNMEIHAHILVPPFQQYRLECNIGEWQNIPNDGCQHFVSNVPRGISTQGLWERVSNLKLLLLSLFLDDLTPRLIKCFSYAGNAEAPLFNFYNVLGNSVEYDYRQDNESFYISGDIFNMSQTFRNDPHYSPAIDSLKSNYEFLSGNKAFARNVNILVDSLVVFNKYFNSTAYNDQNDLLKGIILLISALEGIFLANQENTADISFKFQLIGSIFYEKYANADFIRNFGPNQRKFSRQEFSSILKELYNLRSKISHGNHEHLFSNRDWRKFLDLKNVHFDENMSIPELYKHVALACGLLQKHIAALLIGAGPDILLGARIIDDIRI